MYCGKCGNKVPDGAKFCYICGYQLPQRNQQTADIPVGDANESHIYQIDNDQVEDKADELSWDEYAPQDQQIANKKRSLKKKKSKNNQLSSNSRRAKRNQRSNNNRKKSKKSLVIGIIIGICFLAIVAVVLWFIFGLNGRKNNSIQVSDQVLDEVIRQYGYEDYDDPIRITYAQVTNTEITDSRSSADRKTDYITIKGENKHVLLEAGYLAVYSDEDGEWQLDNVTEDSEYSKNGSTVLSPRLKISDAEVKNIICDYFDNGDLTFDNIFIYQYDETTGVTDVDLTVTGNVSGKDDAAYIDAKFAITPNGWILADINLTRSDNPLDTNEEETETPETKEPETEEPETEAPETEAPETEVPETKAPETKAPETAPPSTTRPETEAPETESPVETTPKASIKIPTQYEVAVFTYDPDSGKTIVIAKNRADKLYYILDTNGNLLIKEGYDAYSKIESPYFSKKGKIYKYNFQKNIMNDVVREIYENLAAQKDPDIYYDVDLNLLLRKEENAPTEWEEYILLDSRYNERYYTMQIRLLDTDPTAGTHELREALKSNGNPYDMIGHTPVVAKQCSFASTRFRLTDTLEIQMIVDYFNTSGKYGAVGTNIPFEYEELYAYAPVWEPEWFVACRDGLWGVLDQGNKQIVKIKYDKIMVFANPVDGGHKLYAVAYDTTFGKNAWGVIDGNGKTVVPFEYEAIVPINFTTELRKDGFMGAATVGYSNENLEFYVKKNGRWSVYSAK